MIGFSHAGITAEGDNRVLFQKAAKELLAAQAQAGKSGSSLRKKGGMKYGGDPRDIGLLTTVMDLFAAREEIMLGMLSTAMARAGSDVFDIWMYRESDTVQATTQAFGERMVLDAGLQSLSQVSPSLRVLLEPILQLYALSRLEADLSWFICNDVVSKEVAATVATRVRELCASLAPHWKTIIGGFGIPEHLVAAPIAGDWARYNSVDNRGEVVGISF